MTRRRGARSTSLPFRWPWIKTTTPRPDLFGITKLAQEIDYAEFTHWALGRPSKNHAETHEQQAKRDKRKARTDHACGRGGTNVPGKRTRLDLYWPKKKEMPVELVDDDDAIPDEEELSERDVIKLLGQ